ncbi:ATP-dependent DNA/RNA helicase DHX36 [Drosophila pseudoobscura]|uniref:RNA helicase n=1 Tax=Drosophila pseudoobscura pseudoobscura TaxID=46245 RepID=A0A6I8UK85_DROPS|nr:ATP-dependent DNA/RNA helicase DHX36 [Drosophila pseudoobscura]
MDRDRDSDSHARKGNRPPGLKGKEIGMYYRDLGRQRAKEREKMKKDGGPDMIEQPKIRLGCSVTVPRGALERVKEFMQAFNKTPRKSDSHSDVDAQFELQFRHLLSVNFHQFIAEKKQENNTLNYINQNLDTKLMEEHRERLQSPNMRERLHARQQLPAMKHAEEIIRAVQQNQVILIVGSTGCGKTTQVPQLLLDHSIVKGCASDCRIICTQPRRISAITIAERVSYERGENLGISVGYQIRLESRRPRDRASITYCTTGVLLQQLQSDPLMHSLSVLILDEIHERSVETDLLMGLLKVILPHRPNLKVILMSATVREQDFCDYFENCPMFRIEGVMFPVRMLYLEDVLSLTNYQFENLRTTKKKPNQERKESLMAHEAMILPYVRRVRHMYDRRVLDQLRLPESEGCEDIDFIADLVYYICENEPEGAILVFLPGFDKISKLNKALENPQGSFKGQRWRQSLVLYPLHSLMPSVEQQAVFRRPPAGKRKVIMSTIIAETSVTIDDVVYVINSGRTKASNYDIASNIQSLDEVWVSKANTQQRKGRAGRVRPGICYNLFSRAREDQMADIPTPDILRSKLESIILSLKLLHIDNPYEFLGTLISAPEQEAIKNGVLLLMRMGALDKEGILTPLGVHLAKLPVDPQMGKMMLMSALFCCLDPITSAAAALSYKSPFYTPLGLESRVDQVKRQMAHNMRSDHLMVHNTICSYRKSRGDRNFCYTNYLSYMTLQQLERMKNQFAELLCNYKFLSSPGLLDKSSNINSDKIPLLRAIIGAGLYPNMAYMRKTRRIRNSVRAVHNMSTDDGKRVNFHPSSVNSGESSFDSDYFVYYQRQKSSSLYLLDSTMVFPMALIIFGDGVEAGVKDRVPYLSVANTYFFKCNPETAKVVLELRTNLGRLLLKKALCPAPIEENGEEKQLIKAIELLLSLDEKLDDDSFSSDEIDDI